MSSRTPQEWMERALMLAAKADGRVFPNPKVGAVFTKNGKLLGEGYHKKFGGPHAEVIALRTIKSSQKPDTLFVTLEPCHHYGKTPPCVDAVIDSGVKTVYIAMKDPNPKTAGKSIRKLRQKGIEVHLGLCAKEARFLNRSFVHHIKTGLPYVIVKVAQSLDGKIAAEKGKQTWLTGLEAKKYVHSLRRESSAIMIGANTLRVDDPLLNVRPKSSYHPKRVILSHSSKFSKKMRIFGSSPGGATVLMTPSNSPSSMTKSKLFDEHFTFKAGKSEQASLKNLLKVLGACGIQKLLVEGGQQLFSSFYRTGLAEEWQIITAPKFLGRGVSTLDELDIAGKNPKLALKNVQVLGEDHLAIFLTGK